MSIETGSYQLADFSPQTDVPMPALFLYYGITDEIIWSDPYAKMTTEHAKVDVDTTLAPATCPAVGDMVLPEETVYTVDKEDYGWYVSVDYVTYEYFDPYASMVYAADEDTNPDEYTDTY